ncbi:diguanylate cyclase domain-containing protein [Deinococcus sp.]|uniref:diguanylate cyclase domain-containing protein n=1 Tax=Deinococcus sp. TaxID=47478 RepID=UPI00286E2A94|nr:diguanylate cyclase [Deinococcus sp.]
MNTATQSSAAQARRDQSPGEPGTAPELLRLVALARYHPVQHFPLHGVAFERLARLAARLFQVPTALISFMDEERQWWGASCGLELVKLSEHGTGAAQELWTQELCSVVMQSGQPLIVADTAQDETCEQRPLVTGNGVRFYAGVPLMTPDGHVIGTLCLLDSAPHAPLTPAEQQTLTDLAALVMDELELRLLAVTSERQSSAHELLSEDLREALAQSETLQAISELSDLGLSDLSLSLDDLLLRTVALCASVCDVDLGSLVALHGDRAFIFPAWHSPRAQSLAALMSRGLRRSECQDLWNTAGGRAPVFVNDDGAQRGAHLAMTQAGIRAQTYVPVGQRGGVQFVMVLSRLDRDRPWRPQQRQLITAVARLTQGLALQRQQQEALASSTAQLELALDSAPLILFGTDAAGTFQVVRGSGLSALNMGGLTGRSVDDVFADAPQIVSNVHRAIGGENFDDVVTVGHLTYDVRYLHTPDTHGNPAGMLGVGYDVTERVQSERRALQSQREAEALLELAQAVHLDVLDPQLADAALDALLRVLGRGPVDTAPVDAGSINAAPGGGLLILWQLGADGYHPVSQRGAAAGLSLRTLNRLHAGAVPVHIYDSLIGVTDRNVYLGGRTLPLGLTRAGVEGVAALPLLCRAGQCLVGLMAYAERPWNPAERELLETAASLFGAGLERRQKVLELEYDARTDALTGVGNRRALNVALANAVAQASRHQSGLCVVSIDLDGLKAVNDQYGHARGDALLSQFSTDLRAQLPVGGELYRLGGDEFVAVYSEAGLPETGLAETGLAEAELPETGLAEAELAVAGTATGHPASWPPNAAGYQRCRPCLEWLERAVAATRRSGFEMTAASAGTARFPEDATTAAELLRQSDERLYAEKERRGNGRA